MVAVCRLLSDMLNAYLSPCERWLKMQITRQTDLVKMEVHQSVRFAAGLRDRFRLLCASCTLDDWELCGAYDEDLQREV
jgi:hypothetical protein